MAKFWIDSALVATYDEAKAFFKTARNPVKGKPLRSWAVLKQEGDDYVVHMKHWHNNSEVGRFKPNNTFEFSLSIPDARKYSATLSQAMYGAIPFTWSRKGMGRYQIASVKSVVAYADANNLMYWYEATKNKHISYSKGLIFDLATHKPLNEQPEEITKVLPDKRKEWLSASKQFKRGIAVKAKMNVIESVIDQLIAERNNIPRQEWLRPDWFSDQWLDVLYKAVKNNDTSISMLKLFAQSAYYSTYRRMTTADVLTTVENVFRQQSVVLRKRFGVFGEEESDE
jgi:hypothetical protein